MSLNKYLGVRTCALVLIPSRVDPDMLLGGTDLSKSTCEFLFANEITQRIEIESLDVFDKALSVFRFVA